MCELEKVIEQPVIPQYPINKIEPNSQGSAAAIVTQTGVKVEVNLPRLPRVDAIKLYLEPEPLADEDIKVIIPDDTDDTDETKESYTHLQIVLPVENQKYLTIKIEYVTLAAEADKERIHNSYLYQHAIKDKAIYTAEFDRDKVTLYDSKLSPNYQVVPLRG